MSNISVDYDVLNQRGSPAWFTDTFANIPTAGYVGRMFISKDTFAFYRDTGTGWDLIGGPGIGTLTGSGVVGQVSFFNGTQVLAGNNNLFWDNTNSRLGINTTTPGQPLDIHSTGNTLVQLNNTSTGNSNISFQNQNVAKWRIGNVYNAGANSFDIQNAVLSNTPISIDSASSITTFSTTTNMSALLQTQVGIYLNQGVQANAIAPYTAISGYPNGLFICPNSGTGYYLTFPASSSYVYTFPASTGTIALTSNLSSYVPYTGATTDLNLGLFNLFANQLNTQALDINTIGGGNAPINFYMSSVQKASISASLSTLTFSANNTNGFQFQNPSNAIIFSISNTGVLGNGTNSFTFPASSGTLALTSDLSGYLPLTGGTLTGALVINPTNTLTIGLDVASNTTRFRSDNTEGFKRQLEIVMGSGTLVQLTAKGYLANYGTDMAFYTATTGGTNASPGIYITGTNNRVGIKTGTPAYDLDISGTMGTSSTAIFGGNVTIGLPTADPVLILNGDNSGGNSYVNFNADNGGTKAQIQGTKFAGTGGQLIFKTLQSSVMTTSMTIQQTGDIGIGVSPTSGQRLSVRGQDATSTNYGLVVSNTTPQSTFIVRNDGAIFLTGPYPFTTASGTNMWIDTSGVIQRNVSSIRYKKDVKNYEKGLNELMKLRPVSYLSKSEIDIPKRYAGMIAEELFELGFNEYVNLNEKGEPDSISYSSMIALLTKAIQELNEKLVKNNIN